MKIPVIKGNFSRGWALHTAGGRKCPKEKLFVMGGREGGQMEKRAILNTRSLSHHIPLDWRVKKQVAEKI